MTNKRAAILAEADALEIAGRQAEVMTLRRTLSNLVSATALSVVVAGSAAALAGGGSAPTPRAAPVVAPKPVLSPAPRLAAPVVAPKPAPTPAKAPQPSIAGGNSIPERPSPPAPLPPHQKGWDPLNPGIETGPPPRQPTASQMLRAAPQAKDLITPESIKPKPTGPVLENHREPIVKPGCGMTCPSPLHGPWTDLPHPSEAGFPRSPNMAPPGTPGSSVQPGPGLLR
jgi:hypothetical protein